MRVLYNASSARVGGGLSYSRDQLAALAKVADVELTVLVSPWNQLALAAVTGDVSVRLVRVPNAGARAAWEQVGLPRLARRADVLVSPGNFGALRSPVPQAVILQNPNYVGHGRHLPQNAGLRRRAKIGFSHLSMRRADLVVAISASLTAEVRAEPRLARVPLVTVTSGSPDAVEPAPGPEARRVVDDVAAGGPFALSVANDYPHKRLDDLAGLARSLAEEPAKALRSVVLVGDVAEHRRDRLRSLAGPGADRLRFLGSVGDRDLVLSLYRHAAVSVSTSELEAWPLTLHEARAQGAPLVVSDIPPHRELASGQAAFFPVGDVVRLRQAALAAVAGPSPGPWTFERSWDDHAVELAAHLRALVP